LDGVGPPVFGELIGGAPNVLGVVIVAITDDIGLVDPDTPARLIHVPTIPAAATVIRSKSVLRG